MGGPPGTAGAKSARIGTRVWTRILKGHEDNMTEDTVRIARPALTRFTREIFVAKGVAAPLSRPGMG